MECENCNITGMCKYGNRCPFISDIGNTQYLCASFTSKNILVITEPVKWEREKAIEYKSTAFVKGNRFVGKSSDSKKGAMENLVEVARNTLKDSKSLLKTLGFEE